MKLKQRADLFRLILPDEFIPKEINEKYTRILTQAHGFYVKPIDFINESIAGCQVLGFNGGTVAQQQQQRGTPIITPSRVAENKFLHAATDINYRSVQNAVSLVDKTLNVTFRHSVGFLSYFIIFESFFYQYARDREYKDLDYNFKIEMLDRRGVIYSQIELSTPLIDGMDMIDLNYKTPAPIDGTFNVIFKYSNIDYQFIEFDANTATASDGLDDNVIRISGVKNYNNPADNSSKFDNGTHEVSPVYQHSRNHTIYDKRTGEVLATMEHSEMSDIAIKNSELDPDEWRGEDKL